MRIDLNHILWYLNIAGEFVLLLRLLFLRMGREYRWFCTYLLLSVLQSISLVAASRSGQGFSSHAYWLTWTVTEPVLIAALIAFTLECYGLVHYHYPGFDDDRPLIKRIVIVGAVICVASLIPDLWASHWQPSLALLVERTVTTLGAMLMVLVVGAYMFMPVLMPPNIIRHAKITLAYLTRSAVPRTRLNLSARFRTNVLSH